MPSASTSTVQLDIGELAARAGLAPSALRFYERARLLRPAGRSGGRRFYDRSGLLQLVAVRYWQEAGLTIDEIAQLVRQRSLRASDVRALATRRIDELRADIARAERVITLLSHILRCQHERLNECPIYQRDLAERADALATSPAPRAAIPRARRANRQRTRPRARSTTAHQRSR